MMVVFRAGWAMRPGVVNSQKRREWRVTLVCQPRWRWKSPVRLEVSGASDSAASVAQNYVSQSVVNAKPCWSSLMTFSQSARPLE